MNHLPLRNKRGQMDLSPPLVVSKLLGSNGPIYFVCFLHIPCLHTLAVSPAMGIVGKIMAVAPEDTSQRHIWGSGNETHPVMGQKSGPGIFQEGRMQTVLMKVSGFLVVSQLT